MTIFIPTVRNSGRFSWLLPLAVVIALTWSPSSSADEPQTYRLAPDDSYIDEIVVVAQKFPIYSNEYPGSLTQLDKKILDTYSPNTIVDIADLVPGLFAPETGARNPTPIIMRGLNFNGMASNNLGGDTYSVASYLNNIPLQGYYSPPQILLKDLQAVEVLRGPQGTLYGASSLSGLISYQATQPIQNDFSIELHSQISDSQESNGINYDTDIVINSPLIDDQLTLRAMVSSSENGGFIDNDILLTGPRKDINDDRVNAGRLSLLFTPNDRLAVSVMYQDQHNRAGDFQADNPTVSGHDYYASTFYLQPMKSILRLGDLHFRYRFNQALVELTTNYYSYELNQSTDITSFYQFLGYTVPLDGGDSGVNDAAVNVDQNNIELRVLSDIEGSLNGIAGISVTGNTVDLISVDYLSDYPGNNRTTDYTITQDQALDDLALFAELTWNASNSISLIFGGRYFTYKDNIQTCDALSSDPLFCLQDSVDDSHTSFKVSASYQMENLTVFSTLSEGFRRGGANAVPIDLANYRSYAPDTTVNYELGLYGRVLNQGIDYSVTLFHIDWEHTQLITGSVSSELGYFVSYIANAQGSMAQGIELEATLRLSESFSIRALYSYTNAELAEDAPSYNSNSSGGDNGYKGDRLPGSPRDQAHLSLLQTHPWGTLTIDSHLSAIYHGDINTQLNDEHFGFRNIGGYTLFNLAAGISDEHWRLGLFINNAANKRAVTGDQPGIYGSQSAFSYVVRPRTIGLDAQYFLN